MKHASPPSKKQLQSSSLDVKINEILISGRQKQNKNLDKSYRARVDLSNNFAKLYVKNIVEHLLLKFFLNCFLFPVSWRGGGYYNFVLFFCLCFFFQIFFSFCFFSFKVFILWILAIFLYNKFWYCGFFF